MKRKLLSLLLAALMACSLLPTAALAAEGDISVSSEQELTEAIAAVTDSGTITLADDVAVEGTGIVTISDGKNITLDLGTHTLTACLHVDGGQLTVKNGTVKLPVPGSSLNSTPAYVHGSDSADADANYSVLNVERDAVLDGAGGYGMIVSGPEYASNNSYGAVINISGRVEGPIFISGNMGNKAAMNATDNPTVINVLDGADLNDTLIMNGESVVNVMEGASITGDDAVAVKRGTLNITGGTFTATGEKMDPAEANYSGSETTGSAISITSTYNTGHSSISVNITGGTFISQNNAAVYVGHSEANSGGIEGYRGTVDMSIKDGSFTGGTGEDAVYIAEKAEADTGLTSNDNYVVEDVVTGGSFSSDVSAFVPGAQEGGGMSVEQDDDGKWVVAVSENAVATVDGVGYTTLAEALTAVEAGGTVTILPGTHNEDITIGKNGVTVKGGGETPKDVILTGTVTVSGEGVTLDNIWFQQTYQSTYDACGLTASGKDLTIQNAIVQRMTGTAIAFGFIVNYTAAEGMLTLDNVELIAPVGGNTDYIHEVSPSVIGWSQAGPEVVMTGWVVRTNGYGIFNRWDRAS